MIAPGVNRPPPIGSLLVSIGLLGEALRGRTGVLAGGSDERRTVGCGPGAMVSRLDSSSASSPRMVAFASISTRVPQFAQNRARSDICVPQEMQNIPARFYHCSSTAAKQQTFN